MLQDALFARAAWLAEAGNEDIATAFLRASFQGWIYCRDNPADCIQYTVDAGLAARRRAPGLDDERDQPADLAVADRHRRSWTRPSGSRRSTSRSMPGIIKAAPPADAYRTDLAEAASPSWPTRTPRATSFAKGTVEVTPGGN